MLKSIYKDAFYSNLKKIVYFLKSIEQNTIIAGQFLYNIVLASAIHQHKSATGIHMSCPF